jgi:hypothetical protein
MQVLSHLALRIPFAFSPNMYFSLVCVGLATLASLADSSPSLARRSINYDGTDDRKTIPKLYCKSPSDSSLHIHPHRSVSDLCYLVDNCAKASSANVGGWFGDYPIKVPRTKAPTNPYPGSGNEVILGGICNSVQSFLNQFDSISVTRGGTSPRYTSSMATMTWEPTKQSARREKSCPRSPVAYCKNTDNQIKDLVFGKPDPLSEKRPNWLVTCDEMPFASTEEGGRDYNGLKNNPSMGPDTRKAAWQFFSLTGTSRMCVTAWQQSLQGNCNGIDISCSSFCPRLHMEIVAVC